MGQRPPLQETILPPLLGHQICRRTCSSKCLHRHQTAHSPSALFLAQLISPPLEPSIPWKPGMLPGDVGMGEGPLLCTGAGRWVSRLPREASAAGHSWAPPLQGTLSLKGPGRAGLGPPAPARGLLGKRLVAHTASASGAVAWCLWGPGSYKRLCHQEPGTTAARAASSLLCPRGSLLTSFKKHRKRPRLPSSFGSVPHMCVLCLVVLL